MNDAEICKRMAEYWLELGGDEEGFIYGYRRIKEAIHDILET